MRRRELIKVLKDKHARLNKINRSALLNSSTECQQLKSERRLSILHEIEALLPEIVDQLKGVPK